MSGGKLIDLLCEAASRPLLPPGSPEAESLEAALVAAERAARARYPKVAVEPERFVRHLAGKLPAGALSHALASLRSEDLFLACACADGDPAALTTLDKEFLSQIEKQVSRFGRSADFADEVRQELRMSLLVGQNGKPGHIADFAGQGDLLRWIRVAASRVAINLSRGMKNQAPSGGAEHLIDALVPGPDPELDFIKLRDRDAVRTALKDAIADLDSRELGLLRLHHLEGVGLDKLAAAHQVHRATMVRWLAAARDSVLTRARVLVRERLKLSARECDSLIDLVRSRLETGMVRALTARLPDPYR